MVIRHAVDVGGVSPLGVSPHPLIIGSLKVVVYRIAAHAYWDAGGCGQRAQGLERQDACLDPRRSAF